MARDDDLPALLAAEGPGALALRRVLAAVAAGAARDVDALVAACGVPRRSVQALLRALGDAPVDPALLPPPRAVPGDAAARAAALAARAPAPLRDLDHVAATPATLIRRADWLADTSDLAQSAVLFLGDHDLTSLALAIVGARPRAVSVVDIDQRVLELVAGDGVHAVFADLRIGLPDSLRERFDLVFTDPPYTPDGVGLFAARALEALREPPTGRVLLAYGYPDSQPALGLKVQRELAALELVYEAVLPGFNAYAGAQAVGSRAAQYVLRPTRRSTRLAARRAERHAGALYTHGRQAVEASARPAALDTLLTAPGALVIADDRELTPAALIRAPLSPRPPADRLVIDLRPFHGRSLVQAALAAWTPDVALVTANETEGLRSAREQQRLAAALAPAYEVTAIERSAAGTRDTVLRLARRPATTPAAAVWARPHERVGDALAHAAPTAAADPAILADRLIDLPLHALTALARTLTS